MATTLHPPGQHLQIPIHRRNAGLAASNWWHELLWVGAAAVLGFAMTAVASGALEIERGWLVLVYAAVAVPLLGAYVWWSAIDLRGLFLHQWRIGLAGAVVLGTFLVFSVQNQTSSARPEGMELIWDLVWLGVVYGLLDALVLTVLPVLATWRALSYLGWTDSLVGKIGVGALAILASLLVAATYHLGYTEYRGSDVGEPLVGNGIMSLGYVLTNNPITAIGSHIAMHIAAVLHGAETTVQLPPHY